MTQITNFNESQNPGELSNAAYMVVGNSDDFRLIAIANMQLSSAYWLHCVTNGDIYIGAANAGVDCQRYRFVFA